MASVFLSYDREDADRARRVAHALEKSGHSVWWDRHIKSGAQYGREIDEALKRADAVVVLWSERSIDSAWVRDEAAAGRDAGKLVPALIDSVDPPLGFRQYQTTDLTTWKARRSPEFNEMLESITALQGRSERPAVARATPPPARRWKAPHATAFIGVLAIIAFALIAWRITGTSSVPLVAVASADPSAASQALARDLLVKLGSLQAARPGSIDLVSQDDTSRKPTLIFQVARSGRGQAAEANLALTDARDRSLLWARDFQDPNGNESDLRQQIAYSAAYALRCALDGMDPEGGRLSRQSLKNYLNACAHDLALTDPTPLVAAFRQVVSEAPWFAKAWGGLLLAETAVAADARPETGGVLTTLIRDIREARKFHPDLAEAYVAEYLLIPGRRFVERGRLLDEGIERNPDSAQLRDARRHFLAGVGRLEESLQDARRAMELDPLSPAAREGYILSMAFAGRKDEALAELEEAEQLWPGATSLRSVRYLLHLRTGDPHEALRLLRAGVLQGDSTPWVRIQETLLLARIDRSAQNVDEAIQMARTRYGQVPRSIGALSQTLVEFDREDELFPILLNWTREDLVTEVTDVVFRPGFADFHKDPRFMEVAKRLGLLDYWRASGKWPDFCSRPDLPYDCKAAAAKIKAGTA